MYNELTIVKNVLPLLFIDFRRERVLSHNYASVVIHTGVDQINAWHVKVTRLMDLKLSTDSISSSLLPNNEINTNLTHTEMEPSTSK